MAVESSSELSGHLQASGKLVDVMPGQSTSTGPPRRQTGSERRWSNTSKRAPCTGTSTFSHAQLTSHHPSSVPLRLPDISIRQTLPYTHQSTLA